MQKTARMEIENGIWEKYRENQSPCLQNKILSHYLYIVTVNAKRMSAVYKNRAELEDIVNQGVIALIECIKRFDPGRGVQFDSYASIRVRGSIIDYIRKQDWIPRDIRKKSIRIGNVFLELQAALNRPPTDEEVAGSLQMDLGEYQKIVSQSNSFAVLSYEELLSDSLSGIKEPVSAVEIPEQALQEEELKSMIASSIDDLSQKERIIISLYYYEELKLKEIAAILGITPSRVSQLHAKALMKMKKTIGEYIRE